LSKTPRAAAWLIERCTVHQHAALMLDALVITVRLAAAAGQLEVKTNHVSEENNMSILKLSSRGRVISTIRSRAVTLLLVSVILLAG
jgi:hypothetical protein